MSSDATKWAWKAPVDSVAKRVILLSLADRSSDDDTAWPSIKRLTLDTCLNRKTIIKHLNELCELGLLEDSGERKGRTQQVIVYRLVGVSRREDEAPDTVPKTELYKKGYKETQKRNSSKNGTVPNLPRKSPVFSSKESQKRDTESLKESLKEPIRDLTRENSCSTPAEKPLDKKFRPPSVTEVFDYMSERGVASVDQAERFVDHYTANGWRVGKNPMRDWQAAVRNWLKNFRGNTRASQPRAGADFHSEDTSWADDLGM